ncbi:MAG: hypothetical protein INH43_06925 [Acidobacteriaceae bacterium]|jgi:hypothetical protein|nr:hypothetical protein [Acidobacteriaceae bacterium]
MYILRILSLAMTVIMVPVMLFSSLVWLHPFRIGPRLIMVSIGVAVTCVYQWFDAVEERAKKKARSNTDGLTAVLEEMRTRQIDSSQTD